MQAHMHSPHYVRQQMQAELMREDEHLLREREEEEEIAYNKMYASTFNGLMSIQESERINHIMMQHQQVHDPRLLHMQPIHPQSKDLHDIQKYQQEMQILHYQRNQALGQHGRMNYEM
jgi:hypothetical protein